MHICTLRNRRALAFEFGGNDQHHDPKTSLHACTYAFIHIAAADAKPPYCHRDSCRISKAAGPGTVTDRCSSNCGDSGEGTSVPGCCMKIEDRLPTRPCFLLNFRVAGGARVGRSALFFKVCFFLTGCGAVTGLSSSGLRSAWLRTQLRIFRKRGRLEIDERRLGAYMRGVGGACEFVQLQRSCGF